GSGRPGRLEILDISGSPSTQARPCSSRCRGSRLTQGYCVAGLLLVMASIRSVERRLARRVARAMLVSPLLRWEPIEVVRSAANTAVTVAVLGLVVWFRRGPPR